VESWLERTGHERGAVVTFAGMWALAVGWYDGRMEAGWRGRSAPQAQRILEGVGLTGDFWSLL